MSSIRQAPAGGRGADAHYELRAEGEREQVYDVQRARILAAMVEVVAERGVTNVTVGHIVTRSGVSRRTFYEQFSGRDDCFLAALDDAIAVIAGVVLPAYEQPAHWRERIRAGLTALLEAFDREPTLGRLLVVESLAAGPRSLECRRHILAGVIAAVAAGGTASKAARDQRSLTGEGIVGGVLSVIHSRLLDDGQTALLELTGPLMAMIVQPYLGGAAAQRELLRSPPRPQARLPLTISDPLRDVEMRLTYRTMRVLSAVADRPTSSNRDVGLASGIADQGQISKLLTRLARIGLVENSNAGRTRGAPNEWTLTGKGEAIERAIRRRAQA
jgi:AcrR family transcriptional regulator